MSIEWTKLLLEMRGQILRLVNKLMFVYLAFLFFSVVEVHNIYTRLGLIPELFNLAPPDVMRIEFHDDNILEHNIGKIITPTQVIT